MPSRLLASIQPLSKNTLLFILLSVLWYSCSFLSSSTSKALLSGKKIKVPTTTTHDDATLDHALVQTNGTAGGIQSALVTVKAPPLFPYPVSLTALQFLFVFAFSYLLSSPAIAHRAYRLFGLTPRRNAVTGTPQGLMGTLVMVNGAKLREMVGLSVFNVTGHAMTAAAIQMVPVSTVHTVKALSPLFTVLSYVLFLNLSYPLRTYISLAPLTVGVIFACSGVSSIEGSRAWLGIALSVGSTVVFVAQNLWSKRLLGHALSGGTSEGAKDRRPSQGGGEVKLDKLNILFWSSGVSVLLMIPLLIWSDLPSLHAAGKVVSDPTLAAKAGIDAAKAASHVAQAASREADLLRDLALAGGAFSHLTGNRKTRRIVWLLFSNGVVHFSQNLLAFSVLGLTSPVTYSIASLFKRVFVICFAIVWFGQTVTGTQWIGIVLTFVGLWLYNDSKQRPTSKSSAVEQFGGHGQPLANREEEAAQTFGMDKGSRRRQGLLPMADSGSSSSKLSGGGGGSSSAGPIWKGMSSTLYSQSSAGPPSRPTYPNGHGQNGPPVPSSDKAGAKRD